MMIEQLLASGIYYENVSQEFGLEVFELKRHDALHSGVLPKIDPVAMIRQMRWLMEKSDGVLQTILSNDKEKIDRELTELQLTAIRTSLSVVAQFAKVTGATKYLDPHVSLPRWQQIMRKLATALADHPEAQQVLLRVMQEDGPPDEVPEPPKRGRGRPRDPNTQSVAQRTLEIMKVELPPQNGDNPVEEPPTDEPAMIRPDKQTES